MARLNHHKFSAIFSVAALAATVFFLPNTAIGAVPTIRLTELGSNPKGNSDQCPGDACMEFVEFLNIGPGSFSFHDPLFLTIGSQESPILWWQNSLTGHENCRTHADSLRPGEYAVVLSRDYENLSPHSRYTFPDSTLLLKCDGSLLSGKLTHNRGVALIRKTKTGPQVDSICGALDPGQTLDSRSSFKLTYPKKLPDGFSLVPRYSLLANGEYRTNPDTISPGWGIISDNGWISEYRLGNPGSSHIPCTIGVWCPPLRDADSLEWHFEADHVELNSGKAKIRQPFTVLVVSVPKRETTFSIDFAVDGHATQMKIDISERWLPENPIRISEIHPRTRSGMSEWFEITNASKIPINLRDWKWGKSIPTKEILTSDDYVLNPGDYLVVTESIDKLHSVGIRILEPPHWQALNDFRDTLFLEPPRNASELEMVCYDADWFGEWNEQSLERIHLGEPADNYGNWVCADHPSPGMPNATAYRRRGQTPELEIGPIPFTPNGDGRDDFLRISALLPSGTEATVTILGFNGRPIRNVRIPSDGVFMWDGKNGSGAPAQVGPFFVVAEFDSPSGSKRLRKRGILWR